MHELGMKLSAEDVSAMMSQAGCRITGRVYYEGLSLITTDHSFQPPAEFSTMPRKCNNCAEDFFARDYGIQRKWVGSGEITSGIRWLN